MNLPVAKLPVAKLAEAVRQMPQFDGFRIEHLFADGMYARKVWRPAGCVIVGRVHKTEHFAIVLKGTIRIVEDGKPPVDRSAGDVWVTHPGVQRATVALTDAEFMTVHQLSDEAITVEQIEAELAEDDSTSNYNFLGQLKDPTLALAPTFDPLMLEHNKQ